VSDSCEDFNEFFRSDFPSLVRFLTHIGWNLEDAHDAAAEAMLSVYQGWAEVDSPRAYVRKVAYRTAARHAKREQERTRRSISGGWSTPEQCDPFALLEEQMEADRRLTALLMHLPGKQRLVMVWHLDGFTNTEIAHHLVMTPATAASHLRHARNRIRRLLTTSSRLTAEVIHEGGAPS
jgi:RNA polymerase sigma factor (sigma-70 family)